MNNEGSVIMVEIAGLMKTVVNTIVSLVLMYVCISIVLLQSVGCVMHILILNHSLSSFAFLHLT